MYKLERCENGSWSKLNGTFQDLNKVQQHFPQMVFAAGEEGKVYGIGNERIIRLTPLTIIYHSSIHAGHGNSWWNNYDTFDLEEAKNNIPGKTVWHPENADGLSYGISDDGTAYLIEKVRV